MGDIYSSRSNSATAFGRKSDVITPDSSVDLIQTYPKGVKSIVVTSVAGGDVLEALPVENDDGDWVRFEGVQVGFMFPFQPRRVSSATTCSVALILPGRRG